MQQGGGCCGDKQKLSWEAASNVAKQYWLTENIGFLWNAERSEKMTICKIPLSHFSFSFFRRFTCEVKSTLSLDLDEIWWQHRFGSTKSLQKLAIVLLILFPLPFEILLTCHLKRTIRSCFRVCFAQNICGNCWNEKVQNHFERSSMGAWTHLHDGKNKLIKTKDLIYSMVKEPFLFKEQLYIQYIFNQQQQKKLIERQRTTLSVVKLGKTLTKVAEVYRIIVSSPSVTKLQHHGFFWRNLSCDIL